MGQIPADFWWFLAIGTFIILSIIGMFIGTLIYSNKVIKHEKDFASTIIQSTSSFILVTDEKGVILLINKSLQDLFEKEIKLNESCIDCYQILDELKQSSLDENNEMETFSYAGKEEIIIRWKFNTFSGITSDREYMIWTGNDITANKLAEITLKDINILLENKINQRNEELRAIVMQSPIAIITFARNGRVLQYNDAYVKMVNPDYDVEKTFGNLNLFDSVIFKHPAIRSKILQVFLDSGTYNSPPVKTDELFSEQFFNNKTEWVVLKVYSVKDDEGNIFRIVILFEDYTEQKRMEEVYYNYKEQQIRSTTILQTVEYERKRISDDLHDSIQQLLTGAKIKLETFEIQNNVENKLLDETKDIILTATSELRNVVNDLHPLEMEKFGLIPTLESLVSRIQNINHINLEFRINIDTPVPEELNLPVYRIIQEAVNNIIKHSRCSHSILSLSTNHTYLNINVSDNGRGFDFDDKIKSTGRGLLNMKRRAEFIGGKFQIDTASGSGTNILINIPMDIYGKN